MSCVTAAPYRFWFNPPVRISDTSTGSMITRLISRVACQIGQCRMSSPRAVEALSGSPFPSAVDADRPVSAWPVKACSGFFGSIPCLAGRSAIVTECTAPGSFHQKPFSQDQLTMSTVPRSFARASSRPRSARRGASTPAVVPSPASHRACAHDIWNLDFFRDEHVRLPQLPDDLFRLVIPLRRSRPLEEKSIRRVGPLHWGGSVSNTSPNVRIDTVHAVQP